jgi:hypothetical protein
MSSQESTQTETEAKPGVRPERKKAVRAAVYRWRESHPDKYKAICRKSSHAYYVKHREEISERRRKEREAERYVAEQAKLAISL